KLAECLLKEARTADAKAQLLICRQQRPERAEPLVGLASCAMEERAWEEAQSLAEAALRIQPGSATVLGLLGDIALRRGNYAEAIRWFRQVLASAPRDRAANL